MKHSISIILSILLLSSVLISCEGTAQTESGTEGSTTDTKITTSAVGDHNEESSSPETEAVSQADSQTERYLCTLDNGVSIRMGDDAQTVIAALGEYSDYMEAPSCVHEGYDKVYTYGGAYTVTTSPAANGAEYVAEISLLSDAVALQCGDALLMIGSLAEDVTALFGEPTEDQFGVRKYMLTGGVLTVTLDEETVCGLVISAEQN